ncbi:antA/AntB antirepressor family protein [Corynebacterium propinquum]|uniref:antA/AntB antirepressor family protein n=1 Tax=Corynebacterium propinquum TaxID=43769 RepID=UPI001EF26339|nr:antA/AntB antirepressor family protein [Corynebacterium propinquum]MCG7230854.1 antA/AntB antirepressor family protein [Corynebacterium propinquum]WKS45070.1 antA/AntB antirepressor family protein [Corynebacterium propinquum]
MGRDLHAFLEVKANYMEWFPRMVEYGFTAGQDFIRFSEKSTGGRPKQDHIISLDMAKEISMIQRTERGKQARQYFIECERRMKQLQPEITPGCFKGRVSNATHTQSRICTYG